MSQTIRERGQKVFQAGKEKSLQGIAAIASGTGISKSSVQRHQQGIKRRNQTPNQSGGKQKQGAHG